jgi:hypothetical protein
VWLTLHAGDGVLTMGNATSDDHDAIIKAALAGRF